MRAPVIIAFARTLPLPVEMATYANVNPGLRATLTFPMVAQVNYANLYIILLLIYLISIVYRYFTKENFYFDTSLHPLFLFDYLCLAFVDSSECNAGKHNCLRAEYCREIPGSFQCSCPDGEIGNATNGGVGCHPKEKGDVFIKVVIGKQLLLLVFKYWCKSLRIKKLNNI